ncbi:MAG TPA: hypothetical protein PK513_00610 [Alphaproteobacteria bacterium]|nr:hypothetical protein [Alphaproteobacteria bacterium]USO05241.1 MAG: hypothetical protein H6859_08805 [Rhodospirillales bacterium]HOO80989.1 hypothetical protein [Alphaproteobacteria bacterium]
MLSEKELAKLTNTLQIPMIVQGILDGQESFTPDMQYGLHEILSDYQPDSALLSIALGAHKIAAHFQNHSPNMAILKLECERIISDYAEIWVRNAESKTLDDNLVFDTLEQIPEDLETLAELLEINATLLNAHNEELAKICETFALQAHAQVLIADTFIDLMDEGAELAETYAPTTTIYNDNVIPFPGTMNAS